MNPQEYLKQIDEVIADGSFKDNWESLTQYQVPQWYKQLKFGIFIHWGVFSVPAYGHEWYSRNMYEQGNDLFNHHIATYGPQSKFGYKDFIPMFTMEKFNPAEWASLFKQSGAKYVLPVAEHHDGFCMYDSDFSEWTAAKMGPHRNVLGDLSAEIKKAGLVFGTSSHRAEHWWFLGLGKNFDSDIREVPYGDLYWPSVNEMDTDKMKDILYCTPSEEFLNDWLVRTCELIDRYRPSILYFDWWIQQVAFKPYLKKMAAYYYNRGNEWDSPVVINYKYDAFMQGAAVSDVERGQISSIQPNFWQMDTSVAKNSWCYTEGNQYKNPCDLVCSLIDIVSKNGTLLLNIGPKSDGTIPEQDAHILTEIGKWMAVNGEGIYETTIWKIFGEGPTQAAEGFFSEEDIAYCSQDIRFTLKRNILYAFVLKWPKDGMVKIKALAEGSQCFNGVIKDIDLLGFDQKPQWTRSKEAMTVKALDVSSNFPVCLKVTMD